MGRANQTGQMSCYMMAAWDALPVSGLLFPFLHRARQFFFSQKEKEKNVGANRTDRVVFGAAGNHKQFFLIEQGHRVVGKEGCRMGKKRTGTKRSGPVSWVWKSVLLGGLIGAGLCALAAALVMGGVIPQEGLMTAGRCAALLGAVASGLICACMAKERKVLWAAVASGCTAVCALMGNLLFVGQIRMPLLWLGAVGAAALLAMFCQLRPKKRKYRRK